MVHLAKRYHLGMVHLTKKILPRHGTFGEKIPPQGEMYHGKHGTLGERYQGENERYQAFW